MQRTNSWQAKLAHKKLVWCTQRRGRVDFWVAFSEVVIIVERLIREAWRRSPAGKVGLPDAHELSAQAPGRLVSLLTLEIPRGTLDVPSHTPAPGECGTIVTVRRSAHTRRMGIPSSSLARWGGVAACLAGISYGAYGYLSDNSDMPRLLTEGVVPVLKSATWALFLVGLVGLHSWLGSRLGGASRLLERAGVAAALLASVVGLLASVVDEEQAMSLWAVLPQGKEQTLLYGGLTVVGVSTLFKDAPRLVGALVLASGALGLVSLLTNPDFSRVLVPLESLHVAFAALFCLSCVGWGGVLFSEAS